MKKEELYKKKIEISEIDLDDFSLTQKLPKLDRMSIEDQNYFVNRLQAIKRINKLNINKDILKYPEFCYKNIYNNMIKKYNNLLDRNEIIEFKGFKVSELNEFMKNKSNLIIEIKSTFLKLDEPLVLQSNIFIQGNNTKLIIETKTEKVIIIKEVNNIGISGIEIEDNCDYGIFINNSIGIYISNCIIKNAKKKAIAFVGNNNEFLISNNKIFASEDGALFFNGNIFDGLIEGNDIKDINNFNNFSAGIAFSSIDVKDDNTAYNRSNDAYLYELLNAPHNIVVIDNSISNNNGQGIYSHGAYNLYILRNSIFNNQREAICLEFASLYCYISKNIIHDNGSRKKIANPDDEHIKLPGISLDNSAYNIIHNNIISDNYASGIRAAKSSVANTIICNTIVNNNKGQNEKSHYFGIELLAAKRGEEDFRKGVDFTPCYENIVVNNIISGKHYAGVYLSANCYINDIYDNGIFGARNFAIECNSEKYNSIINNPSDKTNRILIK